MGVELIRLEISEKILYLGECNEIAEERSDRKKNNQYPMSNGTLWRDDWVFASIVKIVFAQQTK